MPIVTGYEDTPGGHDALVLGAQLCRLTGLASVVGSTGHGLLGRLAPGRTVASLLPAAPCPVAIAPRGYRHLATGAMTVISVAYDGTAEADRAAAVAVHLASRTGAALRFVAVAESADAVPAATVLAQKGIASAPVEIDALADVVVGPVAATLADLPERTDLLVVGSRGYRFMQRLMLGGVAGVLVRTARYPVVIVPRS